MLQSYLFSSSIIFPVANELPNFDSAFHELFSSRGYSCDPEGVAIMSYCQPVMIQFSNRGFGKLMKGKVAVDQYMNRRHGPH